MFTSDWLTQYNTDFSLVGSGWSVTDCNERVAGDDQTLEHDQGQHHLHGEGDGPGGQVVLNVDQTQQEV